MIYELDVLIEGLGGVKQTQDALKWFRKEAKKAGFLGLDLQVTLRKDSKKVKDSEGNVIGTYNDITRQLGFDGLTHYQFAHFANINRDYMDVLPDAVSEWNMASSDKNTPYYPNVSIGWDDNPRYEMLKPNILKNNTPENFEKALREAKKYVDEHPGQAPLITVNSWNEWTETSYLMPCTMYGYGYLQAVQKVFVDGK